MSSPPPLDPATCRVWWADADLADVDGLDASARARVQRLRRPEDRARRATGMRLAAVLADSLAGHGTRVHHDEGRAPRVEGAALRLSIAHAGPWVLVAASDGASVGVDVEPRTGGPALAGDLDALAAQALAPEEIVAWRERDDRATALVRAWTRKEALLKATGAGLAIPPRSFSLTRRGRSWETTLEHPSLAAGLTLVTLGREPEACAAVAVLAPGIRVEEHDATPLLR